VSDVPRLFFALSLPPTVSDELDGLCEGIQRARWALDNDYHITLSFLGEVSPHRMSDVIAAAREVLAPPFTLELNGAGVFPHRGEPRVLWIGLKPEERLMSLQRSLESALARSDFQLERRKYHPHVTLARVERCPREALAEWLGHHLGFSAPPFKVFRFHLYSSVLTGQGSRYTIEQTFALRS
jgi:RNA 2',3'-cyclic 3'-phosphodiesterase